MNTERYLSLLTTASCIYNCIGLVSLDLDVAVLVYLLSVIDFKLSDFFSFA